ncbi:MAG: HIT domain-containing protein [Planctomycetes bacterium]|nr:HIT domain-containing protein [Planctomycetota bacterium]
MTQQQLWAPWRLSYVAEPDKKDEGCFLCHYRDDNSDAKNHVICRSQSSLVVLNRYPYNNGHLLIAPLEHKATLEDLDDAEYLDMMNLMRKLTSVLSRVLTPDGFNIGLNLGEAAGAGLPGHFHWHVVPRWIGDTNFMPVLGNVKVIPQSLEALYELLHAELCDES